MLVSKLAMSRIILRSVLLVLQENPAAVSLLGHDYSLDTFIPIYNLLVSLRLDALQYDRPTSSLNLANVYDREGHP
jgi:hypothetical protein